MPLETILGLVKSRNDGAQAEAASFRQVYIMAMTNRLIRDGLLTQCLQAINKNTSALQSIALSSTSRTPSMTITNPVASNSTPSDAISKEHFASRRTTTEKSLLLLAEITFFVLYSTQILPHELSELLGLLKQLSTLLAEGPVDEVAEWRVALYPVLVVLQLAHVAALNQTTTLFSRQVDAPPFFSPADKEPGNDLPQIAGDKYKLEEVWASGVSRGFCLLAHAVLRQPSTETGACPRSDVIWFLQQASSSRAYSYVRLCLLPTLQTSFFNRPDTLKFLIDVLYELFENLAHIFSMPMYQIHGGRTTEAFSFFPTSQLQHVRDATYALQSRIPTSGAYAMTGEEQQQMSLVDCLDDVMLLYGALCCARPVFANIFWSGSSFHPFVGRAVELVVVDASLISSTVRMLAGMAYGHTNNASAVFTLMRNHLPGRFDWRFVFNCINQYAQQLGNRGTATTVTTSNRQLSPKDTDALLSLMDLIAAVAGGSPLAAEALYQSDLTPVVHLFNLLSCAVAPVLKGGILHALSCLASNCCPSCTADIWTRLESYRLVPSKTSLSSSAGSNIAHQKGFKLELEAVEAAEGMYPVTDGLLSLLLALVNAGGVPSTLGLGYRFPGFLPYLDHVMNAILLKAQNRLYLPEGSEGESQKFRVIAKALKLLTLVLQKYNIHCLQPTSPSNKSSVTLKDTEIKDLLLDFVNESGEVAIEGVATRVWPKPKSAGFIIMSTLLNRSRSRLVDCLLSLLSDTIERSSLSPRVEESLAVGATAVDLLTRLRRHHSSSPQHHHAPHQGPQEYDLTNMGLERCECDGAHWREIMLTQIVTLLYECALREENFLRQVKLL